MSDWRLGLVRKGWKALRGNQSVLNRGSLLDKCIRFGQKATMVCMPRRNVVFCT